jgi:hypothetical protein
MYQLLDKRTRESLSRAVSLGDICLNLSFDLYNQLMEVSSGRPLLSRHILMFAAQRESSGHAGRPRRSSTYPPTTVPYAHI